MLWPVTKPPQSSLYWLDEVHKDFYRLMFQGNSFVDCFPVAFNNVLTGSTETRKRFSDVYNEYQDLSAQLQQEFERLFLNQIRCLSFMGNTRHVVIAPSGQLTEIWSKSKLLGGYLYNTTLGLACYKTAAGDRNHGMDEHYANYKELNGLVCCFCGTEEMMEERHVEPEEGAISDEEKQWRASYDHYLPKKHYPFLAVDFNNLVPCCQKCNEKAKGELDVLHCDNVRTLAFDAYTDQVPVSLQASYENIEGTYKMIVDIEDTGDQLAEKGDTWNRTFQVLPRVNRRLNNFNRSWLGPLLNRIVDVQQAKVALNDEVSRCEQDKKDERDAYFKALCFDAIANKSDGDIASYLAAIHQSYAGRRI